MCSFISNFKILFNPMLFILILDIYQCLNVQSTANLTNYNAGSLADYQFIINRNVSVNGAVVNPSQLSSQYFVQISFGSGYNISLAAIKSTNIISSTIDSVNEIITLKYNISMIRLAITISNISNPITTSTFQSISISILNLTSTIDQSSLSLTFISWQFTLLPSFSPSFFPNTPSKLSNLTLSFLPDIWISTKMSLTISFTKYYIRSLANVTTTTIFTTMTKCIPTCIVSQKGTFWQVVFANIPIDLKHLLIINVISPPTTQPVDIVAVQAIQTATQSIVQTGNIILSVTSTNLMQDLQVQTANFVGQIISLQLMVSTMDVFGPNDTITITMSQPFSMTTITPTLNNGIISGYSTQYNGLNQLVFSSFSILTSTYSKMSFNISLLTSLKPLHSSQPIANNKISLKRNGYPYAQQLFSYSVLPIVSSNTLKISLSVLQASLQSVLTIMMPAWDVGFAGNDIVVVIIPQQIDVIQLGCTTLGCNNCTCLKTLPTIANQYTLLNVSQLTGLTAIKVNIRNPNINGIQINLCQYDMYGYQIQCWKGLITGIVPLVLSKNIFSYTNANDYVYQISNYILVLNFSNHPLTPGSLSINFPPKILLPSSSTPICLTNSQPICIIPSLSPIILKIPINPLTLIYNISLSPLINPQSTQPFQFYFQVFGGTGNFTYAYYKGYSAWYGVATAYHVGSLLSNVSNCQNGQKAIVMVDLRSLPYVPKSAVIVDNPNPNNLTLKLMKTNQQVNFNSNNTILSIPITNYVSLQPVRYQFLIKTSDLLYDIFTFKIMLKNCIPSNLTLQSYKFSGLLGDAGQLSLLYSNILPLNYLQITFPSQYPSTISISSNAISTIMISPRIFNLYIQGIQPLALQVAGFLQVVQVTGQFGVKAFLIGNDAKDYQVARSTDNIKYQLTQLTTCIFPCKLCDFQNYTKCLQCYTKNYTQNYLLLNQQCLKACYDGYYQHNQQCIICNYTCKTCNQNVCFTCISNYYFLAGQCLTSCPNYYYPISINQTCSSCIYPCQKCLNQTFCTSCLPSFNLHMNQCLLFCPSSFIPIQTICTPCLLPCLTCITTITTCVSCPTGYYLYNNSCVGICPVPLVPFNSQCTACQLPCLSCFMNTKTCTSCQSPLLLNQTNCVSNCDKGLFQTGNKTCEKCPKQCLQCYSKIQCQTCAKGYSFINQSCLPTCPSTYYSQLIIVSGTNTTLICLSCGFGCNYCLNQKQCVLCSINLYLFNSSICVSTCPLTYYSTPNSCISCPTSCLSCISSSICLLCTSSTFLYFSECISSCPNKTMPSTYILTLIGLNYTGEKCMLCKDVISGCEQCTINKCDKCVVGLSLDYDRICKLVCSDGYIVIGNNAVCQSCQKQCQACQNQLDNCTNCATGYVLMINQTKNFRNCIVSCPTGMISSSGICINCSGPCLTCSITPTNCTSCLTLSNQSLFLLNFNCLQTCPLSYYPLSPLCVHCPATCLSCNSLGCLTCLPNYFTSSYYVVNSTVEYFNCYVECPQNIPYATGNRTCKKCRQNCIDCSMERCLQCQFGWLVEGQYCTQACTLPLIQYQGVCVNKTDIPINNTTPVPTPINIVTKPSYFVMPVPFTILMLIIILICILSKLQHPNTRLSLSTYNLCCILCIICNVYHLVTFLTLGLTLIPLLLLISLTINYLLNIFFLILLKPTLLTDESFLAIWISHKSLILVIFVGIVTSHTVITILFSHLFGFRMFKKYLSELKPFNVLNYLWTLQLSVFSLGFLSGIFQLLKLYVITENIQLLLVLYQGLDLIIINFVVAVLGIMNLKKNKQIYLKDQDQLSTNSTKKVIFDQSSNQNLYQYDGRLEIFDSKQKNFIVVNQNMFDQLLPAESGSKFTFSQNNDKNNHNYDRIFQQQNSLDDEYTQKLNANMLSATNQGFFQYHNQQQQTNDPKETFEISSTLNVHVPIQSLKTITPQQSQVTQLNVNQSNPSQFYQFSFDQDTNSQDQKNNDQDKVKVQIVDDEVHNVASQIDQQNQRNQQQLVLDVQHQAPQVQHQLQITHDNQQQLNKTQKEQSQSNQTQNLNRRIQKSNSLKEIQFKKQKSPQISPKSKKSLLPLKQKYSKSNSQKSNSRQKSSPNSKAKSPQKSAQKSPIKTSFPPKSPSKSPSKSQKPKQKISKSVLKSKQNPIRYQSSKKQDIQFFIPSYLFSSKHHQPKIKPQERISGVQMLFYQKQQIKQYKQVKVNQQIILQHQQNSTFTVNQKLQLNIYEQHGHQSCLQPQVQQQALNIDYKPLNIDYKPLNIDYKPFQYTQKQIQQAEEQNEDNIKWYLQQNFRTQKANATQQNRKSKSQQNFKRSIRQQNRYPAGLIPSLHSTLQTTQKKYRIKSSQKSRIKPAKQSITAISLKRPSTTKKYNRFDKNSIDRPEFQVIDYQKKVRRKDKVEDLFLEIEKKDRIKNKYRQLDAIYGKTQAK